MNVLFLDFDGVLNNERWLSACRADGADLSNYSNQLDPFLVRRVSEVVEELSLRVVFSTAWRFDHPEDELKQFLVEAGWEAGDVFAGVTPWPVLSGYGFGRLADVESRSECVWRWLQERGETVEQHAVLDDLPNDGHALNWVRTDPRKGVGVDNVRALRALFA